MAEIALPTNYLALQTPKIPEYGYQKNTANLGNLTVAPAGSSLYQTQPGNIIFVGANKYRADVNGQVVIPTADATIVNAKIAAGKLHTLVKISTTA